ncbi:unnamed protein product [Strongylus vulgaris]|uniref:Peptidase M12A domain-containing protein n=1 Tax=Strongylus vulgaris TaxID=40348 RepID=A0A3P7IR70_STRVU|nr:unnamed protein product [Strongylus vulgaris]
MVSSWIGYIGIHIARNLQPEQLYNFAKLPACESTNYNPYEYGSSMHYPADAFMASGASELPMIPYDFNYIVTMGSLSVSFYDVKTINDHYKCTEICGCRGPRCYNGGEPNPRNCDVCNCPEGYAGDFCTERKVNATAESYGIYKG